MLVICIPDRSMTLTDYGTPWTIPVDFLSPDAAPGTWYAEHMSISLNKDGTHRSWQVSGTNDLSLTYPTICSTRFYEGGFKTECPYPGNAGMVSTGSPHQDARISISGSRIAETDPHQRFDYYGNEVGVTRFQYGMGALLRRVFQPYSYEWMPRPGGVLVTRFHRPYEINVIA
jgi:hypothetical protein